MEKTVYLSLYHHHIDCLLSRNQTVCVYFVQIPASNPVLSKQLSTPLNPPPFFGAVGHGPLVPQAVLRRNTVKLKLNYEGPDPQLLAISIITCFGHGNSVKEGYIQIHRIHQNQVTSYLYAAMLILRPTSATPELEALSHHFATAFQTWNSPGVN